MSAAAPWPVELRLKRSANQLEATFDDGLTASVGALELRRASPSAADHGHAPRSLRRPPEVAQDVRIVDLRPIGRYAVQIVFSDGHDSGFYTWPLLHRLAVEASGSTNAQS